MVTNEGPEAEGGPPNGFSLHPLLKSKCTQSLQVAQPQGRVCRLGKTPTALCQPQPSLPSDPLPLHGRPKPQQKFFQPSSQGHCDPKQVQKAEVLSKSCFSFVNDIYCFCFPTTNIV